MPPRQRATGRRPKAPAAAPSRKATKHARSGGSCPWMVAASLAAVLAAALIPMEWLAGAGWSGGRQDLLVEVRPNGGIDAARHGVRGLQTTLAAGTRPAAQLAALRRLLAQWFPSGKYKTVPGEFYTADGQHVIDPLGVGQTVTIVASRNIYTRPLRHKICHLAPLARANASCS
eukprot:SAG31_NODE_5434_length_2541_cov_11.784091_1_plen_174_part_00